MQAYNPAFAAIYNRRWTSFVRALAPRLRAEYETTTLSATSRHLLDLCCGTGQLAAHFLDHGYTVTGLDLSDAMLEYARGNNAADVVAGQARFVQGDAANFTLGEQYGLVVSTFDALNHLPSFDALRACFGCVFTHLLPGGLFAFDLNTLQGLRRWQSISVEDTEAGMLVVRGVFDPETSKGFTYVSGFVKADDGRYDRFEQTAFNLGHALADVRAALHECGFTNIRFVRGQEYPFVTLEQPEAEDRVLILAEKGQQ